MLDFLVRDPLVSSAQKFIDRLNPKVNIHIPKDLPIPAINMVKRMSALVSKVNAFESEISRLTDNELQAKTRQFRTTIKEAVKNPSISTKLNAVNNPLPTDTLPAIILAKPVIASDQRERSISEGIA